MEQFRAVCAARKTIALLEACACRVGYGAERAVSIIGRDALLRRLGQWTVWEHVDERGGKPEPGEDQRRGLQGVGGGFGMLRRVDVASGWRPSMLKTRTKRS